MDCPVCNVTLLVSEKHGVEIDYCPECRGIWLDRGELDKIIDRSKNYSEQYKGVETFVPLKNQPVKKKKGINPFQEILDIFDY